MIQSGGVLRKTPSATIWQGRPDQWPASLDIGFRWASYSSIYRSHLWVAVLVNKLANAEARLPRKVYRRVADDDRQVANDSPYGQLLRRPNTTHDPYLFYLWTRSTFEVYGEAFWGKLRDRGGRPVELVPMHPTNIHDEERDGKVTWRFDNGTVRVENIARRDFVHFRTYNPDNPRRGMSRLEPLRATLENEEGARKANSALWRNGGRPSVFLTHPRNLSQPAADRLAVQWADLHGSVDNWARAAILEEGMEAKTVNLSSEELQYIEARKLNREEACAVYDVPPPVVHILDRATFSNITEQMRSMYRDTMAPKLGHFESTIDFELRDGRMGTNREPDFSEDFYMEHLLDEVLRGDFEVRAAAYRNADYMTVAEKRAKENLPFIEGTDRIFLNSAVMPLNEEGNLEPPVPQTDNVIPMRAARSALGRLSRQKTLADVDAAAFIAGLNGEADLLLGELELAKAAGLTVADLRKRILALAGKE